MYIYIIIYVLPYRFHLSQLPSKVPSRSIRLIVVNLQKAIKLFRKHQTHGMVRVNEHIAARRMQHHSDIQGMWIYARIFALSIHKEYNRIYQILYYTSYCKYHGAFVKCCTQNWDAFTSFDQKTPQITSNWQQWHNLSRRIQIFTWIMNYTNPIFINMFP